MVLTIASGNASNMKSDIAGNMTSDVRGFSETTAAVANDANATSTTKRTIIKSVSISQLYVI